MGINNSSTSRTTSTTQSSSGGNLPKPSTLLDDKYEPVVVSSGEDTKLVSLVAIQNDEAPADSCPTPPARRKASEPSAVTAPVAQSAVGAASTPTSPATAPR